MKQYTRNVLVDIHIYDTYDMIDDTDIYMWIYTYFSQSFVFRFSEEEHIDTQWSDEIKRMKESTDRVGNERRFDETQKTQRAWETPISI